MNEGGDENNKSSSSSSKGGVPMLFRKVSTILSVKRKMKPTMTKAEAAAKKLAEERAKWFEDPTPTLLERDPMRTVSHKNEAVFISHMN